MPETREWHPTLRLHLPQKCPVGLPKLVFINLDHCALPTTFTGFSMRAWLYKEPHVFLQDSAGGVRVLESPFQHFGGQFDGQAL